MSVAASLLRPAGPGAPGGPVWPVDQEESLVLLEGGVSVRIAKAQYQCWRNPVDLKRLFHFISHLSLLVSEAVLPARDTVGEAAVEPELEGGVLSKYHTIPHFTISHHTNLYHSIPYHTSI